MPHHDVKDDIVVVGISVMLMGIPVTGLNVNLDVPLRDRRLAAYNYVPKIGAVVTINSSRVDYCDRKAFC
jgi:hypothetical protein